MEDIQNCNISNDNENLSFKKTNEVNYKNIYYTQMNLTLFLFFIIFFIVCTFLSIVIFIIYLNGNETFIYYIFIPLGILGIASIISSIYPLFSRIKIDIPNDLIIIKNIKILFCFNKTNYINLKEVEEIIIEKNTNVHYEINGVAYGGYDLIFRLNKDKEIKGLSGEIDKNLESQKLFEFLREGLPKKIPISSDLMEINEIYPNLNTQRVYGSTTNAYTNLNNPTSSTTALSFE